MTKFLNRDCPICLRPMRRGDPLRKLKRTSNMAKGKGGLCTNWWYTWVHETCPERLGSALETARSQRKLDAYKGLL